MHLGYNRAMAMNLKRRDNPRCVAAVEEFLARKELIVLSIDDVNQGNDCMYHSLRVSLNSQTRCTPDSLCRDIDQVQQPAKNFKEMNPMEMREAAARTIAWIWDTNTDGYGSIKEVLRVHMHTQGREQLQRLGLVAEHASLETGTDYENFHVESKMNGLRRIRGSCSCDVILLGDPHL